MPPPVLENTGHQPAASQEQVKGHTLDAYQGSQGHDEQHYQSAADTTDLSHSSENELDILAQDQAMSANMTAEYAGPSRLEFTEDHGNITQSTSPYAERVAQKIEDCKFCEKYVDERQLKRHLIEHKSCCALYMKLLKVKTIDNLLTKLFSCEFCCIRTRIDFKRHMRTNMNCFDSYKAKYNELV